jgi:hypothetical protein
MLIYSFSITFLPQSQKVVNGTNIPVTFMHILLQFFFSVCLELIAVARIPLPNIIEPHKRSVFVYESINPAISIIKIPMAIPIKPAIFPVITIPFMSILLLFIYSPLHESHERLCAIRYTLYEFIYSFSLLFLLCTLGLILFFGRPTAHERSLKITNGPNYSIFTD